MFYFQLLVLSLVKPTRILKVLHKGKDWWHVFEISWLNAHAIPQVAIGRITLPASSPNLNQSH